MSNDVGDDRATPRAHRTPENLARLQAIRSEFQATRPGLDDLLATGQYDGPIPLGIYRTLLETLAELKKARERDGLSLADVADRSGIDRAAISRLETGHNGNPTIETLGRYASALGKRIAFLVEDATAS